MAKEKAKKEMPDQIKALITDGIPLQMAVFQKTVRSGHAAGTPETAFYASGTSVVSRIAKMWYTPHGVVTEQQGVYKIIPLASVSDTIVL